MVGLPGLVLLGSLLAPYATALTARGIGAAPTDLVRYGADLTSMGRKPPYLEGESIGVGVEEEGRLYDEQMQSEASRRAKESHDAHLAELAPQKAAEEDLGPT